MPQIKPDIIVVISSAMMIPPDKKVIKPIPLRTYRVRKPIRERKNILLNMVFEFPMPN